MTLPPPNVCRLIAQLHALIGSPAAKEAENAREKLVQLLTKHCCSWNDLPADSCCRPHQRPRHHQRRDEPAARRHGGRRDGHAHQHLRSDRPPD